MATPLKLVCVSEGLLYSSNGKTIVGVYGEYELWVLHPDGYYVRAEGFKPQGLGLLGTTIRGTLVSVEAANYDEVFTLAVKNCYLMLNKNRIQMPQKTYEARKAAYEAAKAEDAKEAAKVAANKVAEKAAIKAVANSSMDVFPPLAGPALAPTSNWATKPAPELAPEPAAELAPEPAPVVVEEFNGNIIIGNPKTAKKKRQAAAKAAAALAERIEAERIEAERIDAEEALAKTARNILRNAAKNARLAADKAATKGVVPAVEGPVDAEDPAPAEKPSTYVEDSFHHVEQERSPTPTLSSIQEESNTVEVEEEDSDPVVEAPSPVEEVPTTVVEVSAPVVEEVPVPVEVEVPVPVDAEDSTTVEVEVPVSMDAEDPVSVVEDSAPVVEAPFPSVEEEAPAPVVVENFSGLTGKKPLSKCEQYYWSGTCQNLDLGKTCNYSHIKGPSRDSLSRHALGLPQLRLPITTVIMSFLRRCFDFSEVNPDLLILIARQMLLKNFNGKKIIECNIDNLSLFNQIFVGIDQTRIGKGRMLFDHAWNNLTLLFKNQKAFEDRVHKLSVFSSVIDELEANGLAEADLQLRLEDLKVRTATLAAKVAADRANKQLAEAAVKAAADEAERLAAEAEAERVEAQAAADAKAAEAERLAAEAEAERVEAERVEAQAAADAKAAEEAQAAAADDLAEYATNAAEGLSQCVANDLIERVVKGLSHGFGYSLDILTVIEYISLSNTNFVKVNDELHAQIKALTSKSEAQQAEIDTLRALNDTMAEKNDQHGSVSQSIKQSSGASTTRTPSRTVTVSEV